MWASVRSVSWPWDSWCSSPLVWELWLLITTETQDFKEVQKGVGSTSVRIYMAARVLFFCEPQESLSIVQPSISESKFSFVHEKLWLASMPSTSEIKTLRSLMIDYGR